MLEERRAARDRGVGSHASCSLLPTEGMSLRGGRLLHGSVCAGVRGSSWLLGQVGGLSASSWLLFGSGGPLLEQLTARGVGIRLLASSQLLPVAVFIQTLR